MHKKNTRKSAFGARRSRSKRRKSTFVYLVSAPEEPSFFFVFSTLPCFP